MTAAGSDDAEPLGLEQAYSVETPSENRALYEDWATTYESGFIDYMGYVYHRTVADLFAAHRGPEGGAVLDVGCGTGIVGEELRVRGVAVVDGIDISPAMIEQAALKKAPDGHPAFRRLVVGDLLQPLDLDSESYDGIVSAGTFTHGHVGPDAFDELLRIAGDEALFTIGINAEHYSNHGFDRRFSTHADEGRITTPELIDVAIYDGADGDHADDRAIVAVFRRRSRR